MSANLAKSPLKNVTLAVALSVIASSSALAQQTADVRPIALNPDGTIKEAIGNLTPGVAPSDGVNVSQLQTGIQRSTLYTTAVCDQLNSRINYVQKGANQGVAAAVAMLSTIRTPSPGKSTINLGGGYYGRQAATALSLAHRSRNSKWQGTAAIGIPASIVSGANIAASGAIGFEF